ncbi:C13 family peptidase [Brevundimonas variabilis]|uniref:Peptidase C13 n=1 Tax=Brevundimonas variabilis TaxID=74312 RepID=A0A7W9CLP1_9CAUL|nr:C13 family peptidase [Brevundimonas variabilis]MBB5747482.1 hypothetical protein [Brevundimonas variabilis]
MLRAVWTGLIGLVLAVAASCAEAQNAPDNPSASRFDGWAAAVIAADWRTSGGDPIQAFDNARRDLTAGFQNAGFSPAAFYDATLRPDVADPVTGRAALEAIADITRANPRGCLLYFTSHGSREALVFGPGGQLTPAAMATLVRSLCDARPTVVIVSACYSGIFVDGLAGPDRMVMTAARRDRNSFGCGEGATYPYFDGCVIESLPTARDFIALAQATKACVARRETEEGLSPPSEPQVRIGANMQLLLPTLRFTPPDGGGTPGS